MPRRPTWPPESQQSTIPLNLRRHRSLLRKMFPTGGRFSTFTVRSSVQATPVSLPLCIRSISFRRSALLEISASSRRKRSRMRQGRRQTQCPSRRYTCARASTSAMALPLSGKKCDCDLWKTARHCPPPDRYPATNRTCFCFTMYRNVHTSRIPRSKVQMAFFVLALPQSLMLV